MKIIVYTANIGNYDTLIEPKYKDKNVEFILFTDDTRYRSNFFNIRYVEVPELISKDPQRVARYFKLQPHKVLSPHDINIWFDSCLGLNIQDYTKIINQCLIQRNLDLVAYKHPKRICTYKESLVCLSMKLDSISTINNQISEYRKQKFPENYGLYDTGFMIRRNNHKMIQFNDLWWSELSRGSKRDQLSQAFCIWKTKIKHDSFIKGISKEKSPYLQKYKHKNKKNNLVNKRKREDLKLEILNRKLVYKLRMR